tara:strand:- start:3752 stop:4597 length:846 start_codon:yes stop_codon:yes gene_type:complete
MSETTTPTPKKGRPAKAKEAATITPVASIEVENKPVPKAKPAIRRESKKNTILEYRLVKKSGATFLMTQKNVTVVEDGRLREIRYCPNEPTIYRDEQEKSSIRQPVVFLDGVIYVRPDQPNLAEYLEKHPENRANGGNRFYLYEEEKVSEARLEDEFEVHDAIGLIRTKDLDDLLSVAISYGINIDRPVNEIKHDLMITAKKSPKNFIEAFDNPVTEMKSKLSQARKYQVIKIRDNGVFWYDSNKLIISVPQGKDPMDILIRHCMTESAAPLVAEIERQLG